MNRVNLAIDRSRYPDNSGGHTVIQQRVAWLSMPLKMEPDGRLVLEDIDLKASDAAVATRGMVAFCEECELACAARKHFARAASAEACPWWVLEAGAGMLESVVALVPSTMRGGMFRDVWVCSDECERMILTRAGLDPGLAGLKTG